MHSNLKMTRHLSGYLNHAKHFQQCSNPEKTTLSLKVTQQYISFGCPLLEISDDTPENEEGYFGEQF